MTQLQEIAVMLLCALPHVSADLLAAIRYSFYSCIWGNIR